MGVINLTGLAEWSCIARIVLLSIAHLPRTILITVLNLFPLGLMAVNLYTSLNTSLI